MAERRSKGLCYNCNEPYLATHQCKKLFWLELGDTVAKNIEELGEGKPEISLHATTSQTHAKTIQLEVVTNEQPC